MRRWPSAASAAGRGCSAMRPTTTACSTAGIRHARGLASVLGVDTENVYLTLSAHLIAPDLQIIARASDEQSVPKLMKAGATRVVGLHDTGAAKMAQLMINPNLDRLVKVFEDKGLEMDMAEIEVADRHPVRRPVAGRDRLPQPGDHRGGDPPGRRRIAAARRRLPRGSQPDGHADLPGPQRRHPPVRAWEPEGRHLGGHAEGQRSLKADQAHFSRRQCVVTRPPTGALVLPVFCCKTTCLRRSSGSLKEAGRSSEIPMIRFVLLALAVSTVLLLNNAGWVAAEPTTQPGAADATVAETHFAELLTGATMAGKYTIEGNDAAPKDDRYRIIKAVKADGDNWSITSSIEYKGFGIPVTLTVPVKWAGDTPVIEVTDQKIPGIGTFTARVLFYGDHYVGTWNGGRGHGGTLWGRVEHGDPSKPSPATQPTR